MVPLSKSHPASIRHTTLFINICLGLLVLVTTLSKIPGHWKWTDRCQHFTVYWAAAALMLIVSFAARKNWKRLGLCLPLACLHVPQVMRLWMTQPPGIPAPGITQEMVIVSSNLLGPNKNREGAMATLAALNADVLILMEVGESWETALKDFAKTFPYHVGKGLGTQILSRLPLVDSEEQKLTPSFVQKVGETSAFPDSWDGNNLLSTTIFLNGRQLRLAAIHPPIPSSQNRIQQQGLQIRAYRGALETSPSIGAKLLMGDFNTTCFSTTFEDICVGTGLRDAGLGYGYHPTWGTIFPLCNEPFFPWLAIPIDHALVSNTVVVVGNELGRMPGSDHRYRKLTLRF